MRVCVLGVIADTDESVLGVIADIDESVCFGSDC